MNNNESTYKLVIDDLTYEEKEQIKEWLRATYPNLVDDTLEKKEEQE